jgi:hypothetical protein
MAKPARGLPSDFTLSLPEEDRPVVIGDFLDEAPPVHHARRVQLPEPQTVPHSPAPQPFTPQLVPDRREEERGRTQVRPVLQKAQPTKVIRYQLNLTPKSQTMFEELTKHIQTYSPEDDARASEVFQGIIGLLHNAMDELELSELPRRGAWGSVTAKNFPGALGESFEKAIVQAARKRGVS